ncbi:hypothetical protein RJT34_12460 [Clitoria ternatea]|uniref:Uncharacterized protein n=1 Tax=Clitoria ternatea TaxID=43366 RepID=A0AAN9PKR5_CLITE
MAYHKAPLELVVKQVVFIKPSKPTPSSVLSLSTLDNRPDLNSLCHTVHVYRSLINESEPSSPIAQIQQDPAHVIKEALAKAMIYYYPLAGRLVKHTDGKLRVNCSADGVPFLEANATNCHLSSLHYLDNTDMEIAKHLVFDLPSHVDENGHYYQYPLVFKVTKFPCGGFTIGMGLSHAVCDGTGASQFFRAIIEIARGERARRHLLDSNLLEGYYGNVIVDADVILTVRELNEKRLSHVVRLFRESMKVALCDMCGMVQEGFNIEGIGACTTISDWRHLDFMENVDFGCNEVVNMVPSPCDMFGSVDICIFLPPCILDHSMKGGVRIFISLPSAAMPKFREEMEVLNHI